MWCGYSPEVTLVPLQTALDVLNMMLVKMCVCGWEEWPCLEVCPRQKNNPQNNNKFAKLFVTK